MKTGKSTNLRKTFNFLFPNSTINGLLIKFSFYLLKSSSTQVGLVMNIIPSYLVWKACSIWRTNGKHQASIKGSPQKL